MFWGRFRSAEEARAAPPPSLPSTYADPTLTHLNEEVFEEIHPFDWPVMFFLRKFIDEFGADSLIDFGGHAGVKFTAFRQLLALPDDFL